MAQELFSKEEQHTNGPVTVLGQTFANDEERRAYFREELRKKLPELKEIEGFPIGEDEDIINLSDPPFYTACPNPWINDFIAEWEEKKKQLEKEGKRVPDFEVNFPYPKNITETINNEIYRSHSYHTKVPHPAIMRLFFHYTQPGDIVIDSFAGTGMTGVAGRKCDNIDKEFESKLLDEDFTKIIQGHRNVILNDLSPIAFNISKNFNSNYNASEITKIFDEFYNKIKLKCQDLFTYNFDNKNHQINYVVWSEVVACNGCNNEINVHNNTSDYKNLIFKDKLVCDKCGSEQERKNAIKVFETIYDDILNEAKSQIKYEPCLVNYSYNGTRVFKNIETKDYFSKKNQLPNLNIKKLNYGDKVSDPLRVGVEYIHQFYTYNIQIFITEYLKLLTSDEFSNYKDILLFALTSILPKLSKMNRYMPKHGSRALVGPMANTLYIPPMFVENNPFDQFKFQTNKIINAFKKSHKLNVSQIGSATNLKTIKSNSVDYVFIDPPFGANIMYSELNQILEYFLKVQTNNIKEAIENKTQKKSKLDYQNLMQDSFEELYRVLKPNKWITIQFSNTSAAIWNTILNSIQKSGFVLANVLTNDNTRGGLHAMLGPTAVKQNLIINCYKPSNHIINKNKDFETIDLWQFIEEHLNRLERFSSDNNKGLYMVERSSKVLYDRVLALYLMKNLPIPIDSIKFQEGLKERFVERDGMYFTQEQVEEYERKKAEVPEFIQMSLFVGSEQDAVYWLRQLLEKEPKTEQDLHPLWMREVAGNMREGDTLPEMRQILEENFLKDDTGKWYVPDAENEADLEKLRNKRLLKIFEDYKTEAAKPKGKLKEVRVEALRVGFKQCYQDKDFRTIVTIGDRIPNNLLMEDEVLLQFYDIAAAKI